MLFNIKMYYVTEKQELMILKNILESSIHKKLTVKIKISNKNK